MKNLMKSFSGLMILFLAMCFMNGCKQETQYVEKTYASEVEFTITAAEENSVTITMTTATQGAVIYYTTDGSIPTTASTKYSKAVTTDKDITVKAIAVKEGYENSPVSSVIVSIDTNTITNTVTKYLCSKCKKEYNTAEAAAACCGIQNKDKTYAAAVTFITEENVSGGVKITMNSATQGAVIYYTTDGSIPTTTSTKYSDSITSDKDITVKAIAVKEGYKNSPVSSVIVSVDTNTITNTVTKYICPNCEKEYDTADAAEACCGIQYRDTNYTEAVTFTVEDTGKYNVEVTMNCATKGAVIYYTTDGSTPTEESEKYEGFVTFNQDTVIKAIAVNEGMENSPISVMRIKIKTEIQTVPSYVSPDGVLAGTYNIYHLLQKTSGGKTLADYDLADTESSKTLEKEYTSIDDLKNVYEGFTAKALGRNDSSVYIFYDRNLITYTFEAGEEGSLTDGNKTRTLQGLYGTSFSIPVAKSDTYFYNGWFTSDNKAPETTFGPEDETFTVKWITKTSFPFNGYGIPLDAESGDVATSSSKYIYYGTFPRSVLGKDEPIIVDENEEITKGGNTYYRGNDGNWYAKVTENAYGSDYSYSDNTPVKQSSEESIRYFRVEPIKWEVITNKYNSEDNLCLLAATEILTADIPFYLNKDSRTVNNNWVYPNNYKFSTMRAYLNGKYDDTDYQKQKYTNIGFLQTAFTSDSIDYYIRDTEVNNGRTAAGYAEFADEDDEEAHYIDPFICENTTDKIFLLSISDVVNSDYGFTSGTVYGDGECRKRFNTDYAKANFSCQYNKDSAGYWWLRSPEWNGVNGYGYIGQTDCVRYVKYNGEVTEFGSSSELKFGIVPALVISLQ